MGVKDTLRGTRQTPRRSLRCVVTGARRALGFRTRGGHRPRSRGGRATDRLSSRSPLSQPRRRHTAVSHRGRRRRAGRAAERAKTRRGLLAAPRSGQRHRAHGSHRVPRVAGMGARGAGRRRRLRPAADPGDCRKPQEGRSARAGRLVRDDGAAPRRARAQLGSARRERQCAAARCRGVTRGVAQVRGRSAATARAATAVRERRHAPLAGLACDGRTRATLGVRSVVAARRVRRQRAAGAGTRTVEDGGRRVAARRRGA